MSAGWVRSRPREHGSRNSRPRRRRWSSSSAPRRRCTGSPKTANAARDLQEFYAAIHEIVAGLMYGENFFIALFDDERGTINFPYYRDAVDPDIPDPHLWEPFGIGNASGLTAFVLRTGEPQHVPAERQLELTAEGDIAMVGMEGVDWLGVPLRADERPSGRSSCRPMSPASSTPMTTFAC